MSGVAAPQLTNGDFTMKPSGRSVTRSPRPSFFSAARSTAACCFARCRSMGLLVDHQALLHRRAPLVEQEAHEPSRRRRVVTTCGNYRRSTAWPRRGAGWAGSDDPLGEVRVDFQLRAWLLGLLDPLLVTLLPQSRTLSGPRGRGHNWSTGRAYWRQTISVRMRRMWLRHEASRRGSSLSWPVCRHRSDGRRSQATPLRRWRT